jgi:hypothetical protein
MISRPRAKSCLSSDPAVAWEILARKVPAMDLIGVSELFSSWPSTRTRRCQAFLFFSKGAADVGQNDQSMGEPRFGETNSGGRANVSGKHWQGKQSACPLWSGDPSTRSPARRALVVSLPAVAAVAHQRNSPAAVRAPDQTRTRECQLLRPPAETEPSLLPLAPAQAIVPTQGSWLTESPGNTRG